MVIGRSCLDWAVYSPIASAATVVLRSSSARHCATEAALLVTTSVSIAASAITFSPTTVLPDPHGSTMMPAPDSLKAAAASRW